MPTIDVKGHLIDFPENLSPDELNKAVGSAAGQLPDAELPKDESSFMDKAAPIISNIARPVLEIGGSAGGALLAGGASAPTVAGIIPGAVAGGALGFAAGKSAADSLDEMLGIQEPVKNVKEAIQKTGRNLLSGVEAESLGMLMKPVVAGIGKIARPAGKKLISAMFGPSEDAISARFSNPQAIKQAKPMETIAEDMASGLQKLSKEIHEMDNKAWDSLSGLKAEPTKDVVKILRNVRKGIVIEGGGPVGKSARQAAKAIDDMILDISSIKQKGQGKNVSQMLDQKQLRKLIKAADENIDWNNPLAGRTNEALIEFRTNLSDQLKKNNPAYSTLMEPIAARMKTLQDMTRAFSIGKEEGVFIPKDTTVSRMKLATKEGRSESQKTLKDFKDFTGQNVMGDVKNELVAEQFRGGRVNGSKNVNLGAWVGGGLGLGSDIFGGSGGMGTAAGAITGAFIDKNGGRMAGTLIDQLVRARAMPIVGAVNSSAMQRVLSAGGASLAGRFGRKKS
jgi:hypothetical protein